MNAAAPRTQDALVQGRAIHNEMLVHAQSAPEHPAALAVWGADTWLRSVGENDPRAEAFLVGWATSANALGSDGPAMLGALRSARAEGRPFGGQLVVAPEDKERSSADIEAAVRRLGASGDGKDLLTIAARTALAPVLVREEDRPFEVGGAATFAAAHRVMVAGGALADGALARLLASAQTAERGTMGAAMGTALARALATSPEIKAMVPHLDAALGYHLAPGPLDPTAAHRAMVRRGVDGAHASASVGTDVTRLRASLKMQGGAPAALEDAAPMLAMMAAYATVGPLAMAKAHVQAGMDPDKAANDAQVVTDAMAVRLGGKPGAQKVFEARPEAPTPFPRKPAPGVEMEINPNAPEVQLGRRLQAEVLEGAKMAPHTTMARWALTLDKRPAREILAIQSAWGAALTRLDPANPDRVLARVERARREGRPLEMSNISLLGPAEQARPEDVSGSSSPAVAVRVLHEMLGTISVYEDRARLGFGPNGTPLPSDVVLARADTLALKAGLDEKGPLRMAFAEARVEMAKPEKAEGALVVSALARAIVETPAMADGLPAMESALERLAPRGRPRLDEATRAMAPFGVKPFLAAQVATALIQRHQSASSVDAGAPARAAETMGLYVLHPQRMREDIAEIQDQASRRNAFARERETLSERVKEIKWGSDALAQERSRRLERRPAVAR